MNRKLNEFLPDKQESVISIQIKSITLFISTLETSVCVTNFPNKMTTLKTMQCIFCCVNSVVDEYWYFSRFGDVWIIPYTGYYPRLLKNVWFAFATYLSGSEIARPQNRHILRFRKKKKPFQGSCINLSCHGKCKTVWMFYNLTNTWYFLHFSSNYI